MSKSLLHTGMLTTVVGLLVITSVGTAWSMRFLTDEQLSNIKATHEANKKCLDYEPVSGSCTFDVCRPYGDSPCGDYHPDVGYYGRQFLQYKLCQEYQGATCTTTYFPPGRVCANWNYGLSLWRCNNDWTAACGWYLTQCP